MGVCGDCQAGQEALDLHFRNIVFKVHMNSYVQVLGKRQTFGHGGG